MVIEPKEPVKSQAADPNAAALAEAHTDWFAGWEPSQPLLASWPSNRPAPPGPTENSLSEQLAATNADAATKEWWCWRWWPAAWPGTIQLRRGGAEHIMRAPIAA